MAYTTDYTALPGLIANSTGLATSQFKILKLASTVGEAVLVATSVFVGEVVGVLQNNPAGGEAVEMAVDGVCKVVCETSTIAIGDGIGSSSTSRASDAGTTDNQSRIGKALEAPPSVGSIISVLLTPGGARY